MAATTTTTALALPLDYVADNSNVIEVCTSAFDGSYGSISGNSCGNDTLVIAGVSPITDGSGGMKLVVPQQVMTGAGVAGTAAYVVLHDGATVHFSVTATGGAAITAGADVTIDSFEIVNPQPTSA